MSTRVNILGQRFYGLTVLEFVGLTKYKKAVWRCQCDCGNVREVVGSALIGGRTRSCGCRRKLSEGQAAFNGLFGSYQKSAKKRNIRFELSRELFAEIIQKNCYYCDSAPSNRRSHERGNGALIYNGIDRIDNKIGYTKKNSVPCCAMCNKSKNNHTKDEFLFWIKKVYCNLKLGEV